MWDEMPVGVDKIFMGVHVMLVVVGENSISMGEMPVGTLLLGVIPLDV